MTSPTLRSLAVSFPQAIRTNDYYRENFADIVAQAEEKSLARMWAAHWGKKNGERQDGEKQDGEKQDGEKQDGGGQKEQEELAFDVAFGPFSTDPFRGTVERRILAWDEPILPLEVKAAREAIAKAGLETGDIDIVLSCAFLPDQPGIGHGVLLARELGLRGAAWNIESACSSATVGFQLASSLIESGQARNVLVVISCSYSKVSDPQDTFGWFLGDGCSAFVLGPGLPEHGPLATKTLNTQEICGLLWYEHSLDEAKKPCLRVGSAPEAGGFLRSTADFYLQECVAGALEAADLRKSDIDFYIFNTPTAWYADFCVRALGIDGERTFNTYPSYANIGPALWPVNLHHAASAGRLKKGDRVLLYSIGSGSSACAVIMGWGEVGLGAMPEREEAHRS